MHNLQNQGRPWQAVRRFKVDLVLLSLFGLVVSSVANASLLSSKLNYDHYDSWRNNDQLYYSTFNIGEQWKPWAATRYEIEPLNLVDQINICYAYKGGWNHYFNECVIDDETQLLGYIETVEGAERFGFHFSAPSLNLEREEDLSQIDPTTLNWEDYEAWSPEKQLYFSTMDEEESDGAIIPWKLDKY